MYLLDTCVIIDLVKGNENTINRFKSTSPAKVAISSITSYELIYGLERVSNVQNKSKSAVEAFLSEIKMLDFKYDEASYAAKIRNDLRIRGTPIGPYDILIAATALSHELTLVTSNEKEFTRIENLKIENWRY